MPVGTILLVSQVSSGRALKGYCRSASVYTEYAHDAVKIDIREFREKLADYLESGTPAARKSGMAGKALVVDTKKSSSAVGDPTLEVVRRTANLTDGRRSGNLIDQPVKSRAGFRLGAPT